MSVTWNDDWHETSDPAEWNRLEFVNMLIDAINERGLAVRSMTIHTADPPLSVTPVVEDRDLQKASFWAGLQGQIANATFVTNFVDTTVTLIGRTATTMPMFTLALARAAAGLAGTNWRRKRPREVASTSSTTDTQGNAAASGQKARVLGARGVYLYAAGTWALIDGPASPDILDSNLSAPNTVARGVMQEGDYILAHIFEEMRAVLNVLVWTRQNTGIVATDYRTGYISFPSGFTVRQDGIDAIEADYALCPNLATTGGVDHHGATWASPPAIYMTSALRFFSSQYYGQMFRTTAADIAADSRPLTLTRTIELYTYGRRLGMGPTDDAVSVFNNFGETVTNGQMNLLASFTSSIAQAVHAWSELGNHVWASPNGIRCFVSVFTGSNPASSTTNPDIIAVYKWNVSGGFTYTSST